MASNEIEIHDKIVKVLTAELDIKKDRVHPKSHIWNDLGADSLQILDIIMSLEEEFDIVISDEAIDIIETVDDIFNEVRKLIAR